MVAVGPRPPAAGDRASVARHGSRRTCRPRARGVTGSFLALLALGALLASAAMTSWTIPGAPATRATSTSAGRQGLPSSQWSTRLADGSPRDAGVLAAVLATIWGWRLGLYLLPNRVLGKQEDGRYRALRAKWGSRADRNFFLFFQVQALFVVFFSLPYLLICLDPHPVLGPLEWTGAAVWAIGNAGAITADRQLARWRSARNRGRTARTGLWAWSRHPNYFFESVTWCGVALVATAAPWGWVSWIVPAVLLFLLFRVTGIPATEARALRSRADYADYQRTTSVFVPIPPRADDAPDRS